MEGVIWSHGGVVVLNAVDGLVVEAKDIKDVLTIWVTEVLPTRKCYLCCPLDGVEQVRHHISSV